MLRTRFLMRVAIVMAGAIGGLAISVTSADAYGAARHISINCAESAAFCTEVGPKAEVFGRGYYVGHDEPSALFYSNVPGSGNRMRYTLTLPTDPSPADPSAPGKSYNFELNGAFWFGMAMCDTQSYPEQVSNCIPDSDKNIVPQSRHPGTAFTELQFYPPGWVKWPTWAVAVGAGSCDPTHWCAALNVDSLSVDPINNTTLNPTCAAKVGSEYVNFAFVTHNGISQAPANPLDATLKTFTPDAGRDLFMNSGDRISVALHDTPEGLRVQLNDLTTGQSGLMTASPSNGFAQIKYAPTGDSCTAIPYAFHPMYSTSSPKTRVIWAAHSYNVAFSDEIGHFQHCYGAPVPATPFGETDAGVPIGCPRTQTEDDGERSDDDDIFCFPGTEASLIRVQGCTYTNVGFDGVSYHPVWPDGDTALHPTPIQFTSPLTGNGYSVQYQRAALEADLPAIESTCNVEKGTGCYLIPRDDEGQPAQFYPYYSTTRGATGGCVWQIGGAIPGATNDFGNHTQWGQLLQLEYLTAGGGGTSRKLYEDFRNILSSNPCPA